MRITVLGEEVSGDGDGEIPQTLRLLEKNAFIQIIMGEDACELFLTLLWKIGIVRGGDSLTERVQEGLVDS